MEVINSKNVINIIRRTLNLIDKRLINHGERVSYILYKMLSCEKLYSREDILNFTVTGLLHDIGAYKNEELDNMVQFETKEIWGHSIYGYLFLKYLSPIQKSAEIVLYHHLDYTKLKKLSCAYMAIASYLNLADRIDVYYMASEKIDIQDFKLKYGDTKFSMDALELYDKAEKHYHIIEHIRDSSYLEELNQLYQDMDFTHKEIEQFLTMLIYSIDFRSEFTVMHTITTVSISDEIGRLMNLSEDEKRSLHYGALLHDIGKISTPINILEAPRKLSEEEMSIMRNHVRMSEYILKDYINEDVLEIAIRHHEKLDGSGYHRGLIENQLTLPQKILAVADIISALCGKRSYKDSFPKEKIFEIISKDKAAGKLCPDTVDCVLSHFDEIMDNVLKNTSEPLKIYSDIKLKYNNHYLKLTELID